MAKVLNPSVVERMLAEYSLAEYDPARFRYRIREYYDTISVPAAASASALTDVFTSSRSAHARGIAGCNLTEARKLPGNTSLLVLGLRAKVLRAVGVGAAALTKAADVALFAEWGLIHGVYVKGVPVLDEVPFGRLLTEEGVQLSALDTVIAAGSGSLVSARGVGPGLVLEPTDRFVIANQDEFEAKVHYNGPASMGAALDVRVSLVGLEMRRIGA